MQESFTFLAEHWAVLSGIGVAGFAVATAVFNMVDRYRKIPKLDERVAKLEEVKDDQCPQHEGCFNDLKDDIKKLDTKICRNIGEVKEAIHDSEEKRESAKEGIGEELKTIHHILGSIEGELKRVS